MITRTIAYGFDALHKELRDLMLQAPIVHVGEWQAQRDGFGTDTAELEDVSLEMLIPQDAGQLATMVKANLPWAEEHFQERVSGIPYNPPPSSERWPFAQRSHADHLKEEKFSHTYPERLWPKYPLELYGSNLDLDPAVSHDVLEGVRYQVGDLADAVKLLQERPATRQAFIPIWFPEDTGAVHGERVPCTLGYHVMVRDFKLSIRYYMRSCDFIRHFNDDVYMAGRLAQWIARQLDGVTVFKLVMHVASLHVFAPADLQILNYRKKRET